MGSTVKKCKCSHEFQDATYGSKNRLCNVSADEKTAKCTVCGDTHQNKA